MKYYGIAEFALFFVDLIAGLFDNFQGEYLFMKVICLMSYMVLITFIVVLHFEIPFPCTCSLSLESSMSIYTLYEYIADINMTNQLTRRVSVLEHR